MKGNIYYKDGVLLDEKGIDNSTIGSHGYRRIHYEGKEWLLHRLIFFYFNGILPEVVDHINGDKLNNRIENLQGCTQKINIAKAKVSSKNKTGYKGVALHKKTGKYESYVVREYKKVHLGLFTSAKEASEARLDYLKRKYG